MNRHEALRTTDDVLVCLICHGIEALRDGDGGAVITAEATLENLTRIAEQRRGAVTLSAAEAGMLEVLAREEVAKHRHPPHDLVRALEKLRERVQREQ
jgi:hypothetical protein